METSTSVLILYGLIGSFGAASIVTFIWGFTVYITRLGTERSVESRDEGLVIMEWGVTILVVVMILIGILRYIQA